MLTVLRHRHHSWIGILVAFLSENLTSVRGFKLVNIYQVVSPDLTDKRKYYMNFYNLYLVHQKQWRDGRKGEKSIIIYLISKSKKSKKGKLRQNGRNKPSFCSIRLLYFAILWEFSFCLDVWGRTDYIVRCYLHLTSHILLHFFQRTLKVYPSIFPSLISKFYSILEHKYIWRSNVLGEILILQGRTHG